MKEIHNFIRQFSFEVDFERPETKLVRYKRDDVRVDVWMSGTIGVYRNGAQKFYKHLPINDIKEVIANL